MAKGDLISIDDVGKVGDEGGYSSIPYANQKQQTRQVACEFFDIAETEGELALMHGLTHKQTAHLVANRILNALDNGTLSMPSFTLTPNVYNPRNLDRAFSTAKDGSNYPEDQVIWQYGQPMQTDGKLGKIHADLYEKSRDVYTVSAKDLFS
jgi:hypothetical protein